MKIKRNTVEKFDLGSEEDEALEELTTRALKMEGAEFNAATKHDLMQKSNEHDHIKRDPDLNRNEMSYSKGDSVTESFLNNTTLGDFFSTPKITPMKRSEEIQSLKILKTKRTFKTNSGNNALNLSREKEDNHKQISPREKAEKQTESVNTDVKTGKYELTSENSDIDTELEKEGLTSPKADFRRSSTTETETQYNNQDKNSNLKKVFKCNRFLSAYGRCTNLDG
ncbi:hypothetical protein CEXT_128811 [Caerostris extrusa]|uniref:Uncharacterized protein n=1 Tax=Caerostris extrusa TaxID=172846 RepID=A0AAV4R6G4_CAEEX|nr:hypothetical protein CEXT_128811 [Caerostris extrusa]